MFRLLNQKGLSLPEILISMGLMAAIGIGVSSIVTQSAKKKNEMDNRLNRMTLEKMIENYFYTDEGCSAIVGRKVGDTIILDPNKFKSKLGKTTLNGVRISTFTPSSENNINGFANLTIQLQETTATGPRVFAKEIPVSVNLQPSGVIQDCQLNKDYTMEKIKEKVCSGTYGSMTPGMTCEEAMDLVRTEIIKAICSDIYGSKSAMFNAIHCNVRQIHANKYCLPNEALGGFGPQGNILCRPVPTVSGPGPGPCVTFSLWEPDLSTSCTTATVNQTRNCLDGGTPSSESRSVSGTMTCGPCTNWANWAPDESTQCPSVQVAQTRSCLDPGSPSTESRLVPGTSSAPACTSCGPWVPSESETCTTETIAQTNTCGGTRTVPGTKACNAGDCIWNSPASWGLQNPVVGPSYECSEYQGHLGAMQTPVSNGQTHSMEGNHCLWGGSCHGDQTVRCVDGNFVVVTATCIPGIRP